MAADDAGRELEKKHDELMEIKFSVSCGALIMGRVDGLCVSERAVGSGQVSSSESSQESATLLDRWFSVQPTSSTAKSSGSRDRWISANPTEGWGGGWGGDGCVSVWRWGVGGRGGHFL